MQITPLSIPDMLLLEPRRFSDARGRFQETWNARGFAAAGLDRAFVQDNHSRSKRGVLRGLHYQLEQPQGKLVRVSRGRAFDVGVDLRRSSPTFGRWAGAELSGEDGRMLWVPPGFAHGFVALEDDTDFLYKCTDYYLPAAERTLMWDDPALAIDWPLEGLAPILSDKDREGVTLDRAETYP